MNIKNLLLKYLKKLIKKILLTFKGKRFCFIYNLISRLLYNSKNYLDHDGEKFILSEKNLKWSFFHQRRCFWYLKGTTYRGKQLHKEYKIQNIKFNINDVVIDVGANVGDFYLGFDDKIDYYGYEPSPLIFSCLKYNIKNQNLFKLGLSNVDNNTTDYYLDDEFANSSILEINNFSKKIIIKTTTLDKEISKINQKIKLLKIEAEGFEPEILQGLKKYLNYIEYITIDCGYERGEYEESTIAECSNYLIKNNFKMIDFGNPRIVALFENLNK